MRVSGVELRRVRLPLVVPFRTSYGVEHERDVLLVRIVADATEGWGECVAMNEPLYTSEYVDSAHEVIRRFLVPRLAGRDVTASDLCAMFEPVKGHPMAKAAIEMAVLDAELRAAGQSLASRLGAVRTEVPAGVAVGIHDSLAALIDTVAGYLAVGYQRIKLKIEPGYDIAPVRAVRERFGDGLLLQVDANSAYTLGDVSTLADLDPFDLLLIEQPLAEDDIAGHATLARLIATPICLDESITSAQSARAAIEAGACAVVNVKPARVGGLIEAVRIHDVCVEYGIGLWCGGMLESGLGRAANVALAALPGFTLPGDLSASDRYFHQDITEPFVLVDGCLRVPTGPGLGVTPLPDVLAAVTTSTEFIHLC